MFTLVNSIAAFSLGVLDGVLGTMYGDFGILNTVYGLSVFLPGTAVFVRRMHDINFSGWWVLFPIVNIVLAVRRGQRGDNRFGPDPQLESNEADRDVVAGMKRKLLAGIGVLAAFSLAIIGGVFGRVGGRAIGDSTFQSQPPATQELVTVAASETNKLAPMMVDRDTELMNAIGVGSILTYNYRLVNVEADGINKAQFQTDVLELLKPDVVRQACTTPETREGLLDRGSSCASCTTTNTENTSPISPSPCRLADRHRLAWRLGRDRRDATGADRQRTDFDRPALMRSLPTCEPTSAS